MNFVTVVSEHVDLVPSEDGQLTETYKGYVQIDSHWRALTIILQFTTFPLEKIF
jgi:hypothetical protein